MAGIITELAYKLVVFVGCIYLDRCVELFLELEDGLLGTDFEQFVQLVRHLALPVSLLQEILHICHEVVSRSTHVT